jgi:hypothetical protein
MFSSPENPDRQINRMAGCATMGLWVWKWLVRLVLGFALFIVLVAIFDSLYWDHRHQLPYRQVAAKATLKDLEVSLKHFKTEYGELPIKPNESQIIRTEGTLLLSLLGEKTAANPRGIKFLDAPIARYGKSGMIHLDPEVQSITPETALVDPWGERYYLLLESTGDEHIPNPERLPGATGKATQRAPESIPASSAIFSSGPDKDPKTWDDNVCSWR